MPRPKRHLHATVEETLTPPPSLTPTQAIARITKAAGNNLYAAELPSSQPLLVELEPKFRSTIYIKRGSFVLVDMQALADRENKLDGEIVNVVRDEKAWRKMGYWYVFTSVSFAMFVYMRRCAYAMLCYEGKCCGYIRGYRVLIQFLHRPKEFVKRSSYGEDSEEEESTVGKMPPSESEDEE